jgi:hypothetical protein
MIILGDIYIYIYDVNLKNEIDSDMSHKNPINT